MNHYTQAIHNVSHHPVKVIEQVIEKTDNVKYPHFLVGTIHWDVWMMYRAIREYERLHKPRKSG